MFVGKAFTVFTTGRIKFTYRRRLALYVISAGVELPQQCRGDPFQTSMSGTIKNLVFCELSKVL